MPKDSSKRAATRPFKRGDRVAWNSEAGRVTGIVQRKITAPILFKGYRRHASKDEPQYIIKSEKTDHIAIHKGAALRKLSKKSARRYSAGDRSSTGRRKDR